MIFFVIVIAAICVAYANGANDNFKGVATLFGSGTTNYRRALLWATGTTMVGSVAALLLAGNLIKSFGGKGLIDDAIVTQPGFAAAVALGAGVTVLIATRIGMPISTTHSLIGALLGTGIAAGSALNLSNLGQKFLIPLLISPILALAITSLVYPIFRWLRKRSGITSDYCLCVGKETLEVVPATVNNCQMVAVSKAEQLTVAMGERVTCRSEYSGRVLGIDAGTTLDRAHFLSSGIVSFARGLNDTPKIAALLLLAPAFGVTSSLIVVGVVIAIGGLLSAFRVAETMSNKITTMNHGQGLTANFVTGLVVIGASHLGVPVSTTHVSCGSLFGLGTVTGGAKKKTIVTILLAWAATLPLAAIFAGGFYLLFKSLATT
jgi:PiT family inorganic phosphate transporter